MSIYNQLGNDVLVDEYFIELKERLFHVSTLKIFKNIVINYDSIILLKKEFYDICRFADILSLSEVDEHKNLATKILAILIEITDEYNDVTNIYAKSILSRTGNFQGMKTIGIQEDDLMLPFGSEFEITYKKGSQKVPYSENIFFTDDQFEVFKGLSHSDSFSFSGPTSMGKSFLIKQFIKKIVLEEGKNIIIIVPTRALISQFTIDLEKEIGMILKENSYGIFNNPDFLDINKTINRHISIFTPERLLAFVSKNPLYELSYLFVDEAQKLSSEESRGLLLLASINTCIKTYSGLKLFFASPNVGNPGEYLRVFGKNTENSMHTTKALVSQNIFVVNFPKKRIVRVGKDYSCFYQIKPQENKWENFMIEQTYKSGGGTLIYSTGVDKAIEYCKDIIKELQNTSIKQNIPTNVQNIIIQIKSSIHEHYYLAEFLEYGVAYHFGNVPQNIRMIIEQLFEEGYIKFLVCTSTLLEGVNLPAKNLFLLSHKHHGNSPFTKIEFLNLVGRAGRLKYDLSGNIFCIDTTGKNWDGIGKLLFGSGEILDIGGKTLINKYEKDIKAHLNIEKITKCNDTRPKRELFTFIENTLILETTGLLENKILTEHISNKKSGESIISKINERSINCIIPKRILLEHPDIDINIQSAVYKKIQDNLDYYRNKINVQDIDYDGFVSLLHSLHDLYDWGDKEGIHVKYLSVLGITLNNWVSGYPLGRIILNVIKNYDEKKRKIRIKAFDDTEVIFDIHNKEHINFLINRTIKELEDTVKFTLEKYLRNFRSIIIHISGKEDFIDISKYIQFGSKEPLIIKLQQRGLSRQASLLLHEKFFHYLQISEDGVIIVNKEIISLLDESNLHTEEILTILFSGES